MTKTLTVANAHSQNKPTRKVEFDLQGGCPHFIYVWLNDVCYTITKEANGRTFKLKRVR